MEENKNKLQEYIKELNDDTQLDRVILEDKQLKLPAIKAKWVSRLILSKKELSSLDDILEDAIEKISKQIKNEADVAINTLYAEKAAEKHEFVKKIKKQIKQTQNIIDFLEKTEKILSTMTYDIKNIVELIKQEQM
jgi:uncharacterized membrane-anchored protein YjiN (DUF445 family)